MKSKCVYQFDLDGNYIQKWDSIRSASLSFGIQHQSIRNCCLGIYNQAGNYIWSFDDNALKIKENISKRRQEPPDLIGEEWRDVIGLEGSYKVSNFGRVKSTARLLPNKYTHITSKSKIITQHANRIGYLKVVLYRNNKPHQRFVHRLVAEAFIPNPDNLPQVNHRDENKQNNAVSNLEWCDASYNVRYSINRRKEL